MVAGKTLEFSKLWPGRRRLLLRTPGQPFETLTQGYSLAHDPGFPAALILGNTPMRWEDSGKRVEFKDEVWMTCGNQFVIDIAGLISYVTRHTLFRPFS
jgi:hypothetical protein